LHEASLRLAPWVTLLTGHHQFMFKQAAVADAQGSALPRRRQLITDGRAVPEVCLTAHCMRPFASPIMRKVAMLVNWRLIVIVPTPELGVIDFGPSAVSLLSCFCDGGREGTPTSLP